MSKPKVKKYNAYKGLPPGTLVYTGPYPDQKASCEVISYSVDHFVERKNVNPHKLRESHNGATVHWFNVNGLSDVEAIEHIGRQFSIHALLLEDAVNAAQRPKVEDFGDYMQASIKMIYFEEKELRVEHLTFVLGNDYVISFQEIKGDVFSNIRDRIKNAKGRIRSKNADYLLYALLDTIVDHYYTILEKLGEELDDLEDELIANFEQNQLMRLQLHRKDILRIRRSVYPLREAIGQLEKAESGLISQSSEAYFRDLYDHTIHVIETIETFKELISGLKDVYMSALSNRMNNIMKVLTIIATIFIPLTFVAGIYGMNFEYMPELKWRYGYFGVWGLMILLFLIMLYYFKKKDWI